MPGGVARVAGCRGHAAAARGELGAAGVRPSFLEFISCPNGRISPFLTGPQFVLPLASFFRLGGSEHLLCAKRFCLEDTFDRSARAARSLLWLRLLLFGTGPQFLHLYIGRGCVCLFLLW